MNASLPLVDGAPTLTELLQRARARVATLRRPVLATYVEPLPGVNALACFARAEGTDDRVYWAQPSDGVAITAVGAAVTVGPSGSRRFSAAARMWRALLGDLLCDGPGIQMGATPRDDAAPAPGPLLVGGFRFDTERPHDPAWLGFPDAWLVVPRLCLVTTADASWLASSALLRPGDEPTRLADALERERDRLIGAAPEGENARAWSAIAEAFRHRRPDMGSEAPADVASETAAFTTAVAAGAAAVHAGDLEKVVLARAESRRAARAPELSTVLDRLAERFPGCHLFAVVRGRRAFVGASPERLVRVHDGTVRATCLAGSIRRGADAAEDAVLARALQQSAKDREEHAIVVRRLTAALAACCDQVTAAAEPVLLTMENVHHLYTPVTAQLRADHPTGPLELLERLHPTPAVGGSPREAALRFIRQHEGWDRGWYAAPVGWLDAAGNAEFAVALRSALLDGQRATLFAGCGIVGDSLPEAELAESELKLQAMRDALDHAAATASTVAADGRAGCPAQDAGDEAGA